MAKAGKSRAEEKFSASQKKDQQVLKEREKAWNDKVQHMASLKALRLVKAAADKEAATRKAAAKNKKPSRLSVKAAGD